MTIAWTQREASRNPLTSPRLPFSYCSGFFGFVLMPTNAGATGGDGFVYGDWRGIQETGEAIGGELVDGSCRSTGPSVAASPWCVSDTAHVTG